MGFWARTCVSCRNFLFDSLEISLRLKRTRPLRRRDSASMSWLVVWDLSGRIFVTGCHDLVTSASSGQPGMKSSWRKRQELDLATAYLSSFACEAPFRSVQNKLNTSKASGHLKIGAVGQMLIGCDVVVS